MEELFQLYLIEGVFIKGIESPFFDRLIHIARMINISWIIDAEINFKGTEKMRIVYYRNLCCSLAEPYLTELALQEYRNFFRNLKQQ